jgi:hypothetical protein
MLVLLANPSEHVYLYKHLHKDELGKYYKVLLVSTSVKCQS